jgi:DNA-binding CsgD family transcriptional regulator
LPLDPARRRRAEVVRLLIRAGWNPPTPTDQQADRIVDDIYAVAGDRRHGRGLGLTAREAQILTLTAEGNTGPEIAKAIQRSPETVRDAQKRIRRKLGAKTNAHAVALARRAV